MKADIIVFKDQAAFRVERGRAGAEVRISDRPLLKIRFAGGRLDLSLTPDEAINLGAMLILCAEQQLDRSIELNREQL
jgi:hypothetical protein